MQAKGAAVAAMAAILWGLASAQTPAPPCTSSVAPTLMGPLTRQSCPAPSQVRPADDYGQVIVDFDPAMVGDVAGSALRSGWLRRLFDAQNKTAVVTLEVTSLVPGAPQQVLANVPLATYSVNAQGKLEVREVLNIPGGAVTPRFRNRQDQVLRARLRVAFTNLSSTQTIATLAPAVQAAKDFGGHGWVVSAYSNQAITDNLKRIETMLNGVRQYDLESTPSVDMRFGAVTRSRLDIQGATPAALAGKAKAPAAAPPIGRVDISLRRLPSAFVDTATAQGGPDYAFPSVVTPIDLDRFLSLPVGAGTLAEKLKADQPAESAAFDNPQTLAPDFEAACTKLRSALGASGFALSSHDQLAVFFALVANSPNGRRQALRQGFCLSRDAPAFERYRMPLPAAQ